MSTDAVVANLKSLKLFGMAGAVAELAEQGAPTGSTGLLQATPNGTYPKHTLICRILSTVKAWVHWAGQRGIKARLV